MIEHLISASTLDPELTRFATEHDMRPAEEARVLLGNISDEELHDHVAAGNLTAVSVAGLTYVAADQIRALTLTLAERRTSAMVGLLAPMRALLRAFLADRPVTLLYGEAVHEGRPLVCARRGRGPASGSLSYTARTDTQLPGHAVVVSTGALSGYAREHPEVHDEVARLPVGPSLVERLCTLDGVAEQHHVTPAAHPEGTRSRRVYSWVRLDTGHWPVVVPQLVADTLRTGTDSS